MKPIVPLLLILATGTPAIAAPPPAHRAIPAPAPLMLAQAPDSALASDWRARLDATEAVTGPGSDIEKAEAALLSLQSWYETNQAGLTRLTDYKALMPRQLKLQIKLARVTAVRGLVLAETAVKQRNAALITGPNGADASLAKADALAASIGAIIGNDHEAVTGLKAYIDQVRAKVREKASQVAQGGSSAGGRLHPFTVQTYETWCANMREDQGHLSSSAPLETKIRELEGGWRWFQSNQQELEKHPDFAQQLPQMRALLYGLAELKGKRAVEMAQQGLRDMNPNYFSESSGTYQQLNEADAIIETCARKLGPDEAGAAAARAAVKASRDEVGKLGLAYAKKSAATFKIPAETYTGSDKAKLRQMIVSKWKSLYPSDQILDVRFIKSAWERRRETTYNNGTFYHYDTSALLAYVIIKKSAELGTVYPVYVNRNNQSGAITIGAETKGSSYSHQDVLLKNIR